MRIAAITGPTKKNHRAQWKIFVFNNIGFVHVKFKLMVKFRFWFSGYKKKTVELWIEWIQEAISNGSVASAIMASIIQMIAWLGGSLVHF